MWMKSEVQQRGKDHEMAHAHQQHQEITHTLEKYDDVLC